MVLAFWHADEIAGLGGGIGDEESAGVGHTYIFRGENYESAGKESRVFTSDYHFGQPVECCIRIRAPDALDEGGSGVVMLVFIAVVANVPFFGEGFKMFVC